MTGTFQALANFLIPASPRRSPRLFEVPSTNNRPPSWRLLMPAGGCCSRATTGAMPGWDKAETTHFSRTNTATTTSTGCWTLQLQEASTSLSRTSGTWGSSAEEQSPISASGREDITALVVDSAPTDWGPYYGDDPEVVESHSEARPTQKPVPRAFTGGHSRPPVFTWWPQDCFLRESLWVWNERVPIPPRPRHRARSRLEEFRPP